MKPATEEAPSFEKVAVCIHCGLCLEACPTYRELRLEMDSPRGRIYFMKGLLNGRIGPTGAVLGHIDKCLACRACETACPSGVEYGSIVERARAALEPGRRRSPAARVLRWILFRKLLPSRPAQEWTFRALRLQQALGIAAAGRWLGLRGFLPGRLGAAAAQAPFIPPRSFRGARRDALDPATGVLRFPARGERRFRVALFTGCLADRLFSGVNEATVQVLTRNGCEVEVLPGEACCGALHLHNGERGAARDLARRNVAAFGAGNYDAIVSNAAGCGAELRHYGELLEGDGAAKAFSLMVRDLTEWLEEIGWTPPAGALKLKVAYDEPCHLVHAQRIGAAPRAVLGKIPGIELVPLEEADACCGSAGIYSVVEPELSARILARKIEFIRRSACDAVATDNPGCILQIRRGLRDAGLPIRVAHPAELLAEAYVLG